MLTKIISQYLTTHRRLVIPGVGAFIVKDSEKKIYFSELLKSDDGVLRNLLAESGKSEIEVAATIDRFIFELKHATQEAGGELAVGDIGVLRRVGAGKLLFVPKAEEPQVPEVPQVPQMPEVPQEPIVVDVPVRENQEPKVMVVESPSMVESEGAAKYSADKIRELYSRPQTFREKDPEVEDLAYGKKQKPLNGYSYVNSSPKKGGVDKVMVFGIAAAVIALAAIGYGYYIGHIDEISDLLIEWGWK